jgi:hypothetical protein
MIHGYINLLIINLSFFINKKPCLNIFIKIDKINIIRNGKMSLLENLCDDLKREIFLLLDDDELEKVSSNVLKENDIFWRMRTCGSYIPTHKDMYDMTQRYIKVVGISDSQDYREPEDFVLALKMGFFDKFMKSYCWDKRLVDIFLNDDEYIKKYADTKDGHGQVVMTVLDPFHYSAEIYEKLINYGAKVDEYHLWVLAKYMSIAKDAGKDIMKDFLPIFKMIISRGVYLHYAHNYGETASSFLKKSYTEEELKEYGIWEHL